MILPVDSDPADHRHEYHGRLDTIRGEVIRLGAMTTETISRGTAVLLDRDLHAAQEIIDADDELDTLSLRIEEQCFRILALQSPMASELRFIVCSIRMVSELERSADLVVNICKAARRLFDVEFDPKLTTRWPLRSTTSTTGSTTSRSTSWRPSSPRTRPGVWACGPQSNSRSSGATTSASATTR